MDIQHRVQARFVLKATVADKEVYCFERLPVNEGFHINFDLKKRPFKCPTFLSKVR